MRDQLSEEGKRELLAYTLSLADVIRGVLAAEDPEGVRKNPDAIKRRAAEIADNVTGLCASGPPKFGTAIAFIQAPKTNPHQDGNEAPNIGLPLFDCSFVASS
jgi:hypothetical protein